MFVYLDNNATTPIDAKVLDVMLPYMEQQYGNPSSRHLLGREARAAIDLARQQVASLVNVHPTQIVFTSGGTEANNMAVKGSASGMTPGVIAISEIEHHSVLKPAEAMKATGWKVSKIAVDESGKITDSSLSVIANEAPKLISVMLANNETGVINDVMPVRNISHQCGAVLHTDAVQALGKMSVDFKALGVDLMTLSAHKIYGPKGAGALVADKSVDLKPFLHGGGHEKGWRAGTENVAAIVGFGKAAELAATDLNQRQHHMQGLQKYLEMQLLSEIPGITIFGQQAERLPNTTFFAVPAVDGETLLMALDQAGVAVSSGSACGSSVVEPSHVLTAMGIDNELARGAVRVSVGKDTTRDQLDQFVVRLKETIRLFRGFGAVA